MLECPKELYQTQKWFAALITRPLCKDQTLPPLALSGTSIEKEVAQKIQPSPTLLPHERIQIYSQQYWWRLIKILQENFPFLLHLMGYEPFNNKLAIPYLHACPPTHWALCRLGETLPNWILHHYSKEDQSLIYHSAAIDFASQKAFWEGEYPPLSPHEDPAHIFQTPLKLQPTLSLFALPFDLFTLREELMQQEIQDNSPSFSLKKGSFFFLVYRNAHLEVCYKTLSQGEYQFLTFLNEGLTPKEGCERLEKEGGLPYKQAKSSLPLWFKEWISQQWLSIS